ncbi:YkgJ family cysteine cluster protein [Cellvibrio sp. KY-YJ-3]|uniref:YkgJ family cysteine cluster protein n=1 Tax=Cellvibrio sp. KY-YJ-3 TaxID=454662 RepID=UPI001246AA12|nr:YkgJ family cysteine cluster protein [Cellvibrio sp. KY-YJ-3]QEY13241.1 YkgJ family cysteine cluster protein [Cellvibrio sp. KY-YJ-3]
MSQESPCLSCGACCAHFRVSFYWGECQSTGGLVPDELTVQISPHHACMKGTETNPARCTALTGDVGSAVSCSIYENRSSTCREFNILDEEGKPNEACTRARARHGLPPVHPSSSFTLDSAEPMLYITRL